MHSQFVADGALRFKRAKATQQSVDEIKHKYAAVLEQAEPNQKEKIIGEMTKELILREKTSNHQPTSGTLW